VRPLHRANFSGNKVVPLRRVRRRRARVRTRPFALLSLAALAGAAIGIGSIAVGKAELKSVVDFLSYLAFTYEPGRIRPPQPGDYWRRCDDARAAGTAPIFRGEPGYRDRLDRDADGIACEPYRGM
jgi:hypothetical protein